MAGRILNHLVKIYPTIMKLFIVGLMLYLTGCGAGVEMNVSESSGVPDRTQSAQVSGESPSPDMSQTIDSSRAIDSSRTNDSTHSNSISHTINSSHTIDSSQAVDSSQTIDSSQTSTTYQSSKPVEVKPEVGEDVAVTIIVSGKKLIFDDRQPVLKDGEVYVPVFGVFEYLYGANNNKNAPFTVNWDDKTSTATIKNRWYTVIVASGEQIFTCNGDSIMPAAPQQIIDGVFMLPLTAIAQAMEATVEWEAETNIISIFYESMIISS